VNKHIDLKTEHLYKNGSTGQRLTVFETLKHLNTNGITRQRHSYMDNHHIELKKIENLYRNRHMGDKT
jgi:hypothetical protein